MNGPLRAFQNMPLKRKLIVSYLTVIIIPIAVLGIYAYGNAKEGLRKQQQISMDNMVGQVSAEIAYRLERQENPIKSIVFHPTVIQTVLGDHFDPYDLAKSMNQEVEPIFWNYMYFSGDIKDVTIYSENMTERFGRFILPADAVQGEAWYGQTRTTKTTKWWYEQDKLFATRNIYDTGTPNVIGVLVLKFDIDKIFGGILKQQRTNAYGFLVADRANGIVFGQNSPENPRLSAAISTAEGETYVGEDAAYAIRRVAIPRTDWTLVYYEATDSLAQGTRNILRATGIIILICLVVLLGVILMFSKTLLTGIHRLNAKMQSVAYGDLSVMVKTSSKDEIGQLSNRFDLMLKKINSLINEVYESKLSQKEAEMKSLLAQINPHFLYNSLSLINTQAIRHDVPEIVRVVSQLSKFYRTTLNRGQNVISIRDELTNAKAYIEIQQTMHGERFDVEYDIDDSIFQYEMIRIILQPIVENAIEHGIDENREVKGKLVVSVRAEGDDIVFRIEDNGVGMEQGTVAALLTRESEGYGLMNVHERLRLFFGPTYGLSIASVPGEGTTVQVRIPKYSRGK